MTFSKKQQPKFEELRAAIEAAITAHHTPAASPAAEPLANQLAKLNTLHQQGVLSAEEFAAAKVRLLGS